MRPPNPQATATASSMALQAPPAPRTGQGKGKSEGAFLGLTGGFLDLSTVDTTPGARCAMAPPAGSNLDADGYRDLMRTRYRTDPGARQHMLIFARRIQPRGDTHILGQHATEALTILEAIGP